MNERRPAFLALTALLLAVSLGEAAGAEPSYGGFEASLRRVPAGTNALILIDAAAIRRSEYAKQQSRTLGALAREMNPTVFAPAEVERLALASNLDTSSLTALWEVALVDSNVNISAREIAEFTRGELEKLGDLSAVKLPIGAYCAKLGDKSYGIYAPADRQMIARWLRAGESAKGPNLSEYLGKMADFTDGGTQIIMALDLTDVLSASDVRESLLTSEALKDKAVNVDRLADLITTLRGVTLGVRFTTTANASVRVDFGRDASTLADVAKPLLIEVLRRRQAMIDDIEQWTAEVKGSTVYLAGPLSIGGLRRVTSLIDPPSVPLSDPSKSSTEAYTPTERVDPKAAASQKYFKAVNAFIEDLRRPDSEKMITVGQQAIWFDRYAKRIDQLPILNVDSELLDYGARTTTNLRKLSGNYRNVGITASKESANPNVNYDYYNTGNGYYYGRAQRTVSDRTVATRVGTADAAKSQFEILRGIDDDTAAVRRLMTERYQIQF